MNFEPWVLPAIDVEVSAASAAGASLEGVLGGGVGAIVAPTIAKTYASATLENDANQIINNWSEFYDDSTYLIQKAVTEVNHEKPCMSSCPFSGEMLPWGVSSGDRISWAFPSFKQENAIFASNPFVYSFDTQNTELGAYLDYTLQGNLDITAKDPVKVEREQVCNNLGPFATFDRVNPSTCPIASIGHPNLRAQAYAEVINEILKSIHFSNLPQPKVFKVTQLSLKLIDPSGLSRSTYIHYSIEQFTIGRGFVYPSIDPESTFKVSTGSEITFPSNPVFQTTPTFVFHLKVSVDDYGLSGIPRCVHPMPTCISDPNLGAQPAVLTLDHVFSKSDNMGIYNESSKVVCGGFPISNHHCEYFEISYRIDPG